MTNEEIESISSKIKSSKNPVIVVDRGILTHSAEDELLYFSECINAPVLSTTYSYGAFPQSHPLSIGFFNEYTDNNFAYDMVRNSDLVIILGMRSDTIMSNKILSMCKDIIFIALDEVKTLKNNNRDMYLCDLGVFLHEINSRLNFNNNSNEIINLIQAECTKYNNCFENFINSYNNSEKLHFGYVFKNIYNRFNDPIVICGVGNHQIWARSIVQIEKKQSFISEGPWATMGSELGNGIIAKKIYPDKDVIVVTGDGPLLMSGSDIITAVNMKTNIIIVVLNDSKYGMINNMQKGMYGESFGYDIGKVNFCRLAESVGAKGIKISNSFEVGEKINLAIALSKSNVVVVDVECGVNFPWPRYDLIMKY